MTISHPTSSIAHLTSFASPLEVPGRRLTAADLPLDAGAATSAPAGLYIHVPFCVHKCHYCDFYSLVDTGERQPAFARRLADEISAAAPRLTRPLDTVFVGGGTPTLLAPDLWAGVLAAVAADLRLAPDVEFTVEANPETVTGPLLEVWWAAA